MLAPQAESQLWRWGISHDGTPGPGRSAPASPRQPAQDDAALQQQRPGNAQQLPLADAEVAPALFDHVRQAGPPQAGAPASSDTQRERLRSLAVADWATPGGGGHGTCFLSGKVGSPRCDPRGQLLQWLSSWWNKKKREYRNNFEVPMPVHRNFFQILTCLTCFTGVQGDMLLRNLKSATRRVHLVLHVKQNFLTPFIPASVAPGQGGPSKGQFAKNGLFLLFAFFYGAEQFLGAGVWTVSQN